MIALKRQVWFYAIIISLLASGSARAGLYSSTVSPGNVPWPGGTVPYVFETASRP